MFSFRPSVRKITSAILLCLTLLPSLAIEQELVLDYRLNERIVPIPAGPDKQAMMETTVFKPNGPGPFPLLIINHGKDVWRHPRPVVAVSLGVVVVTIMTTLPTTEGRMRWQAGADLGLAVRPQGGT
jgi:hypothetical protein